MAKSKSVFYCQSCGYESAKWLGKCPSCEAWNTFAEEVVNKDDTNKNEWRQQSSCAKTNKAKRLDEVESSSEIRINSGDEELNRVLGGGIVPGSLVLIGGEPGIGKPTLTLSLFQNNLFGLFGNYLIVKFS